MARTELVRKPLDRLERDEEKGWILEGDNRIISFRSDTFVSLQNQLDRLVGSEVAATILNQVGMAAGRAAMGYSKIQISSQDDLAIGVDSIMKARGWGRCLGLTCFSSGTRTTYTVRLKNSALPQERRSEPSCHLLRGIISGWLEAYTNSKALNSIERECEAVGKPFCIIEIILEKGHLGVSAVD